MTNYYEEKIRLAIKERDEIIMSRENGSWIEIDDEVLRVLNELLEPEA